MFRICGRRRSLLNLTAVLMLVTFYTTSLLIFRKIDDRNLLGDDQMTLNRLLAKRDALAFKESIIQSNVKESERSNQEENRHVINNAKWSRKPYSPNAVFRDGILGNYEPKLDMNRTGPGEYGVPIPQEPSEKDAIAKSDIEFGFNMVNSDKISLDRIVKDIRHPECKYWHYPENLPTASVVLVFHNEGWSTFVRTVHSIINMSPPKLLHEVVLVDDGSDKEHLKSRLDEHMVQFGSKVKIIRNSQREGLIRARSIGARGSSGDVVVFLDAHCECSPNWLPPLLTRIAYDRTIMAAPIIDGIDWSDYGYRPVYGNDHYRGIFEWGFFYKEIAVPKKELAKRQHHTEPYWSPTNAGGLFAIDREYFLLLGAYDPKLELWGGENFELAFKLWQCGGSSEWVPCSRVGHIYRHHAPFRKSNITTKLSPTLINYVRVVETWMDDEFKEYFYRTQPQTRGYPTDISKELQFKKDNKCKSYKWFMDNVAYDIFSRFPPPTPNQAWGRIQLRKSNGTRCIELAIDYKGKRGFSTYPCHGSASTFRLNTLGRISIGERCILALDDIAITQEWCSTTNQTGPWQWDQISGTLYNKDRHKCMSVKPDGGVDMKNCDKNSIDQKWDIVEHYSWK